MGRGGQLQGGIGQGGGVVTGVTLQPCNLFSGRCQPRRRASKTPSLTAGSQDPTSGGVTGSIAAAQGFSGGSRGGSRLVRIRPAVLHRHTSVTCDSGLQLRDDLNAAASVKGVGGAMPAGPIP